MTRHVAGSLDEPLGRRVSNFNFAADIQVDVILAEANRGLVAWPRRLLALHDTATSSLPMSVPLVHEGDRRRANRLNVLATMEP